MKFNRRVESPNNLNIHIYFFSLLRHARTLVRMMMRIMCDKKRKFTYDLTDHSQRFTFTLHMYVLCMLYDHRSLPLNWSEYLFFIHIHKGKIWLLRAKQMEENDTFFNILTWLTLFDVIIIWFCVLAAVSITVA